MCNDRIIKALNENSAKVFSAVKSDTDEPYSTPPKSGSDAKKPDKLSDKEIEDAMALVAKLLGFGE